MFIDWNKSSSLNCLNYLYPQKFFQILETWCISSLIHSLVSKAINWEISWIYAWLGKLMIIKRIWFTKMFGTIHRMHILITTYWFFFNGIDYFTRKHINITIVKLEWNYGFLCLELFYCFSERGAHIQADFNIPLNYENMSKIFYYKSWM